MNHAASTVHPAPVARRRSFSFASAALVTLVPLALVAGCAATESSRSVDVMRSQSAATPWHGERVPVAIGKFDNRSDYMRGVFSGGADRLSTQARSTLVAHLQQSNRFEVQDRDNLEETAQEARFRSRAQKISGARYIISGAVTEFGRKETGDQQLFGILGRGKHQLAYSKVTLNVVDVTTSQVAYSSSGAGEYELSNREVIGFGGTAGYDSTLNAKVLDLAMRNAIDGMVKGIDSGEWNALATQSR